MQTTVLIVPGIGGSGSHHWQTLWENSDECFVRVRQRDWAHPVCGQWLQSLERCVARSGTDTVLVGHSLGCALIAHWATKTALTVKAALLVAVPDPNSAHFPRQASGFSPLPRQRLRFPSILVASSNDPYASMTFAHSTAAAWGSRFVDIGAAGHINSDSGLGVWPLGRALLRELMG